MFLAFFGNTLDIEMANGPQVGFNFQSAFKSVLTMAAGMLGTIGWWTLPAVRNLLKVPVGLLAITLGIFFLACIPTSVDLNVSLVSAIAYWSYLLLVLTAIAQLGPLRVFSDAIFALLIFQAIAWLIYLVFPSTGVYLEAAGANDQVARMHALGHPNALGRSGCVFVILALTFYRNSRISFIFTVAGCLFGFATIRASLSRTALIACIAACMLLVRDWFRSKYVLIASGPFVLLICVLIAYVEHIRGFDNIFNDLAISVSKTGDAEEITSATGRTEIWAESWRLIMQRPVFGWGTGTSPILLPDFSHQTHNILLNPMLGMGLGAGLVVLIWLLINIANAIRTGEPLIAAVTLLTIVSGLTENTILPTFPEVCTLSWLIISFWPYLRDETPSQKDLGIEPCSI
jgi:O-antigen ligase